jgi:hypothetical protein
MKSSDLTSKMLLRIEQHHKENPIRLEALRLEFGLKDVRQVKSIIARLIDLGAKIGSCKSGELTGVFIGRDAFEMIETADRLRQEGRKLFIRANKLMDFKSTAPTVWEQQLEENSTCV